jgi:hypothetical protein
VADDDAAGGQQLLDHTQPKREADILPDGMADNLGGEPVTGIAGAAALVIAPTIFLGASASGELPS